MYLCLYGALSINNGFGGELSSVRPATRFDYMVCCSLDPTPDSELRYLLYDCNSKGMEELALGVCSWLSFRSSSRVSEFRVQLCNSTLEAKDAANHFVAQLIKKISPQSIILSGLSRYNGSPSIPAQALLLELPSELREIGDRCVNTSTALGYYESALTAMMHWNQHRDLNAVIDWKSLLFDLISSRLDIHLRQEQVTEMKEIHGYEKSLDIARDWCSSNFLTKEKRVTFFSRYAEAQEIWGNTEKACIIISVALKLDPDNQLLQLRLRRLRPSLSKEIHSFLRDFGTIFSDPTPSLHPVSDEKLLREKSCSVCLTSLLSKKSAEISSCKHTFHEDCIVRWLQNNPGTCPLCRVEL